MWPLVIGLKLPQASRITWVLVVSVMVLPRFGSPPPARSRARSLLFLSQCVCRGRAGDELPDASSVTLPTPPPLNAFGAGQESWENLNSLRANRSSGLRRLEMFSPTIAKSRFGTTRNESLHSNTSGLVLGRATQKKRHRF